MIAYADKVILKMEENNFEGIEVNASFPVGKVVSVGHLPTSSLVPDSEKDPLEVGDTVVLDGNARGVEIEEEGETYHIFRKMQILYIK